MKRCSTPLSTDIKRPAYERANLVDDLRNEIQKHQDNLRNHLAELFFLENEGNLLDLGLWSSNSNPYLENYIQQIKCASTDALGELLEMVPTGHTMPRHEFKKEEASSTPFMRSIAALSEGGVMERAKHEAMVVQQVATLKQQGIWSLKRLPKVKEPDRIKCHWDYLLEEMQWLSTDFSQERKWKKAAARKLAYAVAKVFEEREAAKRKKLQDEEKKLKKIANKIAKEVMKMWSAVEKVHKYKQESQLEERRRKLMDTHLNFIIGQTEQFSTWLTEGFTKSKSSVMLTPSSQDGDVEFKPPVCETLDDEETIAAAEREEESDKDEVEDLKKQNEMGLDELMSTLPPEMLDGMGEEISSDYNSSMDSSTDDEETIEQEEKKEGRNEGDEIADLQAEQDVPLDELIARYVNKRETASCSSPSAATSSSQEEGESEEESDVLSDAGDADAEYTNPSSAHEMDQKIGELCNGAAEANSATMQPPRSKLPFLLRGTLREYQEVGLQWLVAMETRKLNGILADEMGLGKTMQTIALLAHLACYKGVWGPHLIIVPTSVLLNWDLEFKKWLPAFKVMSYYGSQKERREKRIGWTKPNTFHVCVTSYKLVVQDYRVFRSKKWYYLILDEAHNIKNFKSQRWQLLLNFNSQRRLLLTGTPLQNNLMELWSLMHFLMPSVFGSQSAFREWFSNPLVGMVEGTEEYNAHLIERLHKILRPFLLRRLKKEVELQLPTKTESVLMCELSRRQRALYQQFLERKETRDTLSSGRFISVIGILMQLRKVCNHPDLFEERGVVTPLGLPPLKYDTPALVLNAVRSPVDLDAFNLNLAGYESILSAHAAHRTQQIKTHRVLIEELNYKGAVPDNLLYSAPSHCRFPPPRPASPTLPPLPLLRQMPSLGAPRNTPPSSSRSAPTAGRSTPRSSPHPMSSPRSLPSPRSLHFSSPTPPLFSLSSPRSDSSEPPPLLAKQITRKQESRESSAVGSVSPQSPASGVIPAGYFRDPVSGIVLPLVEPGMPPPRRPPLGPPQLTNYTGSRSTGNKRGSGAMLPPTLTHGSSCSSPEPPSLRTQSPRHPETSPGRGWERGSGSSTDQTSATDNPLFLPSLEEIRIAWRASRRKMMADLNDMRCQRVPMYGCDLIHAVSIKQPTIPSKSTEDRMRELEPLLDRFTMYCSRAQAPPARCSSAADPPAWSSLPGTEDIPDIFYPIRSKLLIDMPETRLIQYDCGKLQRMDRLLAKLKRGDHRVLIFTQMTRMLNVLERFLNYHGYTYLRLDGTTKVDARLELMERFNADNRIFCMILSTRSGGVGVNLTGADTVIFYDSDWNPTMDAQAQDRCHRIGQTRDVHIYRLVCASTIEENILKKANQKRLLGAVAIEEGNFTTAFFKKDNMAELFGSTVVGGDGKNLQSPKHRTIPKQDLETVLGEAEDDEDRCAMQRAKSEQNQEARDFDEEVPIEGEAPLGEAEKSLVSSNKEFKEFEEEFISIEQELMPIEKYALKFLEDENAEIFSERLKQQDEEMCAPDTSLQEMQAAQQQEEPADELLLTYASWDPQENDENWSQDVVWRPPTPPLEDHDIFYLDPVLQSMYCTERVMQEDELPEVTIIPNLAFQIIPPAVQVKEEPREPPPPPPQALAIPPPEIAVIRQDSTPASTPPLEESTTHFVLKRSVTPDVKQPATPFLRDKFPRKHPKKRHVIKIKQEREIDEQCYWLPAEEYALHQAILSVQELQMSPCSTPLDYNWHIISDILNISSNGYKTPIQCRERYMMMLQKEEAESRQNAPGLPSSQNKYKTGRISAEEAGQSSASSYLRLFQEIDKLCTTKPIMEYKPLTVSSIAPNPTHVHYAEEVSAVVLATRKRDRENKENKDKQVLQRREGERKAEYQTQGMPPHKMEQQSRMAAMPSQAYPMPSRKMPEQMGPGGMAPRYSLMTPGGGVKQSPQFYLLSTQRPIAQGNMQGAKPMMQSKILVSAAQQGGVKMQPSPHIGYVPGYMQVNNSEEMVQHMKRPQYRPHPASHGNMIPLNMVHKPYMQNGGPYIPPIRGNAKGVRSMGNRGMPPHLIEEHARIMPHQVVRGMAANHANMPPSTHITSPPPVLQQMKRV